MKISGQDYTLRVLENGLKIVHLLSPRSCSGIFGIAVRAGSRDERPGEYGLAHFVEHTIFKGTRRRSSWHIINRMEAVGGELNAYTTKEETVVYSIFPNGTAPRAIELIADLVKESRFPEREIDKEREVVADEIDSYLDTPSEAVFDDFEELLFKGHPVAHNILGTRENLQSFTPETCRRYLHDYYTASNMVAFYCGPQSADRITGHIRKYFGDMTATPRPTDPATGIFTPAPPARIHKDIDSHQAHTVAGICAGSVFSSERFAIALLANISGGPGMNSLLNVEMREKRGLVYSVETSTSMFSDCGMFAVYFGCDPDDTDRCLHIMNKVFAGIADGSELNARKLSQAKKQYIGQLQIASENRENSILSAARSTLYLGRPATVAEVSAAIDAVDAESVRSIAARMQSAAILTFGPK